MNKKYFGTDGIRGCVGEHPITAEFMLKLGWAAGKVFAEQGFSRILIGKDTRISGYMFESALEAGIISAGVSVSLLGPMPTPAIAYLTALRGNRSCGSARSSECRDARQDRCWLYQDLLKWMRARASVPV